MKHFLLKFNHGVEIGARLAYIGHFERTGELGIYKIIEEEAEHRLFLKSLLAYHNELPSTVIDGIFTVVGNAIRVSCRVCPLWSLDLVARVMESFAVFNYTKLARVYLSFAPTFAMMAAAEDRHGRYFSRKAS